MEAENFKKSKVTLSTYPSVMSFDEMVKLVKFMQKNPLGMVIKVKIEPTDDDETPIFDA